MTTGDLSIPHPKIVLAVAAVVVLALCVAALPLSDVPPERERTPTLKDRVLGGVRFNYNTRALLPEDQTSVRLQDEINERFQISADPTAVYSRTLEEAKEIWDEFRAHPDKYPAIDQIASIYTFVPEAERAAANVAVLEQFKQEIAELDWKAMVPKELQDKLPLAEKILSARPFGVDGLPQHFVSMFRHNPEAKAENHGYLTFIYPRVDLWDGKQMLAFADQTNVITTASGREYRAAGLPLLFAELARIVLWDGKVTLLLTTLWILLMVYLDFRSIKLAAASIIPLGVGLVMTLGVMAMTDHRLNFMNIIILPILLGFGVSHGLYLLHRFLEGTSPLVALRSVGAAVASSTLTTAVGFAALFAASHNGLKSIGYVACIGLVTMLVVSFTVLGAVLEIMHQGRVKDGVVVLEGGAAKAAKSAAAGADPMAPTGTSV